MSGFLENQRISLIAPAGPCKTETVLSGKAVLEAYGGTVRIMPHVFDGGSLAHLSAADEARAADINDAVSSGDQLIWAVRGGCGCLRILDRIDWSALKRSRKIILGFSDITAIHWAMAKHGIDTYCAAPMMKFMAEKLSDPTGKTLISALKGEPVSIRLDALRAGEISGVPLPGNIAVAAALCGTEFMPDTTGKILILEEVGEAPYRLERMLTQLRLSGVFANCRGIVFGNFTDCGGLPAVMPILHDLTGKVDCPVFYGLPFGHELPFFCTSGMQELTVSPR